MDFIIISDNASSFHCESLYKETGEVQQIFFPKTKIHRMVLEKSYEYNGVVVSMLKSCVVLSDDDSFANRLTTYVDNMPHQRPGEEAVNSYLNMLRNNISYLKCADDKLEKDLIVSTIFVLLSHILAYNFITGTKHCIRILKGSPYYQPFLELMEDYKIKSDEAAVISFSEKVIKSFLQDVTSTGTALNNVLVNKSFVIFFPHKKISDNGMLKLIESIDHITKDCIVFAFQQDKWQAMNEGIYIRVKVVDGLTRQVLRKIVKFDASVSLSRLSLGIEMSCPYYTSFNSGVFFGGQEVLDRLSPSFAAIWSSYFQQFKRLKHEKLEQYIFLAGIYLIQELSNAYTNEIKKDKSQFYSIVAWLLLPDVVNPNGYCNLEQINRLKDDALLIYSRQYEESGNAVKCSYEEALVNHRFEEMEDAVNLLIKTVSSIKPEALSYPDIYPFKTNSDIFYSEICQHCLSILQLTNEEKLGIIFNAARLQGICLEESL